MRYNIIYCVNEGFNEKKNKSFQLAYIKVLKILKLYFFIFGIMIYDVF